MKYFLSAITLIALYSSTALGSDSEPKLKIVDVKGSGTGCKLKNNGDKDGWDVTINDKEKAIAIAFEKFIVDTETKEDNKFCNLRIYVSYPQGTTIYTYGSEIFGDADMGENTSAKIATTLRLPIGTYPNKKDYVIEKGHQGTWDFVEEYPGSQRAPCGGEHYKIGFDINMDIEGKDGVAKVAGKLGKFSKILYFLQPCSN